MTTLDPKFSILSFSSFTDDEPRATAGYAVEVLEVNHPDNGRQFVIEERHWCSTQEDHYSCHYYHSEEEARLAFTIGLIEKLQKSPTQPTDVEEMIKHIRNTFINRSGFIESVEAELTPWYRANKGDEVKGHWVTKSCLDED